MHRNDFQWWEEGAERPLEKGGATYSLNDVLSFLKVVILVHKWTVNAWGAPPQPPRPAPPTPSSSRDWGHRGLLGPASGSHTLSKEAIRFCFKSWVYSRGVGRGAVFHFLLGEGGVTGMFLQSPYTHLIVCGDLVWQTGSWKCFVIVLIIIIITIINYP